jgi:hypothetical protein
MCHGGVVDYVADPAFFPRVVADPEPADGRSVDRDLRLSAGPDRSNRRPGWPVVQTRPPRGVPGWPPDDSLPGVKTNDGWSTLGEINHWIRFADTKASVLLAAGGVVGGILLSRPEGDLLTVRGIVWSVATASVALSSLFALLALLPRLRVRRQAPTSLLYFDHIARRFAGKADDYAATFALAAGDVEAMRRELAGQILANSVVARRKFRHVTAATWFVGLALVGCGAAVYLERL